VPLTVGASKTRVESRVEIESGMVGVPAVMGGGGANIALPVANQSREIANVLRRLVLFGRDTTAASTPFRLPIKIHDPDTSKCRKIR
jgi:hypothetical protein